MVTVDLSRQILVMDSTEKISLREERKRTGRYMAAGVAIFLSLLGVYQAVVRGTPQYAALFAPALIMFIYILWILYASKNQQKMEKDRVNANAAEEVAAWNTMDASRPETPEQIEKDNPDEEENKYIFGRSYSIA